MLTFMRREMMYETSSLLVSCCSGLGDAARKGMSSAKSSKRELITSSFLACTSTESMSARDLSTELLQALQLIMPTHRQLGFPNSLQLT